MKTNYLLAAILCCLTPLLHAQTALSGKVVSADTNEPLAGVNIRVDNSLTGCTTNGKGEFIIDNLPDGQHTLRFSYIGFTPKKYTADGQEENILVKLEESYSNLSQVVVTGTGTHRRMTDSPVPVSVITAKEIGSANVSTLEEALVKLTPNTTSTNTNVNTISASRAPVTETPSWQALAPVPLTPELEVSTQRTAEPKIAPIT